MIKMNRHRLFYSKEISEKLPTACATSFRSPGCAALAAFGSSYTALDAARTMLNSGTALRRSARYRVQLTRRNEAKLTTSPR